MTRILKGSQFYLHIPFSSANGMNHTCLAFPAEAGTHLPTPEGWKAELVSASRFIWDSLITVVLNYAVFIASS